MIAACSGPDDTDLGTVTVAGQFDFPCSVIAENHGWLYAIDSNNNRIQRFDGKGWSVVTEGSGFGVGQIREGYGIAVDADGRVYVADTAAHRIQTFFEDEWRCHR